MVEASESTNGASTEGRITRRAEGDEAVHRVVGVDQLQRAEGNITLRWILGRFDDGLSMAEMTEGGDGRMWEAVVRAFLDLGLVDRPGGGGVDDGTRGILGAEALEANEGLQTDAWVGILEAIEERLNGDARDFGSTVSEGAEGELADSVILGEANQAGGRILPQHLLVGEDRGDAVIEVCLAGGSQSEDGGGLVALLNIDETTRSFEALHGAIGSEQLNQFGIRDLVHVHILVRGHAVGDDLLDHALLLALTEVAEATRAPVGDVEARAAVDVDIRRILNLMESLLLGDERRFELLDRVIVNRARGPIAGEERFAPTLGEAGLAEVETARARAATVVRQRAGRFVIEILIQTRVASVSEGREVVEACVPTLTVVGVVAGEEVERRGDGRIADIAGHLGVDFQLRAIGTNAHYAAAVERHALTVAALGASLFLFVTSTEVADRNIEPAIDAHAATVGGMVSAAGVFNPAAKAIDQENLFIGLAVAILVPEGSEERGVHQIEHAAHPVTAARRLHLGVLDHHVGLTGPLGVAGEEDAAHPLDVAERTIFVGRNINIAVSGGRDGRRVDFGLLGGADEFTDGEAFGHRVGGSSEEQETQGGAYHRMRGVEGVDVGFSLLVPRPNDKRGPRRACPSVKQA